MWQVLGAVKTEFDKFGEALDAVSKKIHQAGTKIDDVARRSRVMKRRLRDVEELPESEAQALLGPGAATEAEEEEDEADVLELVT